MKALLIECSKLVRAAITVGIALGVVSLIGFWYDGRLDPHRINFCLAFIAAWWAARGQIE